MNETWLPVLGNADYEVSELGRVRSLLHRTPRLLKPYQVHPRGYQAVNLMYDSSTGRRVYSPFTLHRLVLSAFIGPAPSTLHGCHRNGDVRDNRLDNLYWGTPKQHAADTARHGTHRNTAKTHCAKAGHEFTPENTVIRKSGARNCLACKRESERVNRLKRLGRA